MKILCIFGKHAYGDTARGEGYEYANFLPSLRALGHETDIFDSFDRGAYSDFADLNRRLVSAVADMRPDLLFCVLMHYEVWTETLDLLRSQTPVAVLHWGTDDSWKFRQFSRFLAPHVDVHVTTDKAAFAMAQQSGLNNVALSQWAASDAGLAAPITSTECAYEVSFVGAAYGERRSLVEAIRKKGIAVSCFGHGWENGPVSAADVQSIYRRSRISINIAEASWQLGGVRSRQIKARSFEVPGAGGFLLTQVVPGLGDYFDLDREIATFEGPDELEARIRQFLENPEQRDQRARNGHARVARDHTYARRFKPLIADAVRVGAQRLRPEGWNIGPAALEMQTARHRTGPGAAALRSAMITAGQLLYGNERGARAARRLAFEVSWRLSGKHTYSSRGWPGRLFYRES
jgi:spore maturation protein CgeB